MRRNLVALLALAVLTASCGGGGGNDGEIEESRPVTVTGGALPLLPETGNDPAVGMTIPEFAGASFDGTPVTVELDGRPKVLLILAHW